MIHAASVTLAHADRAKPKKPKLARYLALAVTLGALIAPAGAYGAGAGAGCLTVHVGPQVRQGGAASYFRVTAAAGSVTSESVLVANPQAIPCRVILAPAYGKTAINSGDSYPVAPPAGSCVRTSCWISGLPSEVTVPGKARVVVPFEIRVPTGSPGGEYLAGVVVRPDTSGVPTARPTASTGVGAAVTTRVGIGVAVRVPGLLHPLLTIPTVTLDVSEGTPLLRIVEHDGGNTWEHPAGGALISTSGARTIRFGTSSSTILPGDSAKLTLPVAGTSKGSHPTEVILWYAHNTKKAVWRGVISYPSSTAPGTGPSKVVHQSSVPAWIIILAVILALMVLLLLVLLFALLRKRRDDDDDEPGADEVPAPRREQESVGSSV